MPTILFVHGTGVRKPSYLSTFRIIRSALDRHGIEHQLEPCLWGDDLGARPPAQSLPTPIQTPAEPIQFSEEEELARWGMLYQDPLFELRLLANRPSALRPMPPTAPRPDKALWARIFSYKPSERVADLLQRSQLQSYWSPAWDAIIVADSTARSVLQSSPNEIGEPAQAIARALVASTSIQAFAENVTLPDSRMRDGLVEMLIDDWEARVAGIGTFLRTFFVNFALSAATPIVKWRRAALSSAAAPAAGDVLLYQARGQAIRDYIRQSILRLEDEVTLLAHSLGGIACVDLLASENIPTVRRLITAGSQAPLLHELGALVGLVPGTASLPDFFPPWLNFYDPHDFLSYVGERVFPGKIKDHCVRSGQPFPHSHSAYWTNDDVWKAILAFVS